MLIGLFRRLLGKMTSRFMPTNTKRMIVLASLSVIILPLLVKEDRERYCRIMNRHMDLAKSSDSMAFAIEVGRILWSDIQKQYNVNQIERQVLVEEILNSCPESLYYDNEDKMRQDISEAIRFAQSYAV